VASALARTTEVGRIYRHLAGARVRAEWQYRTSFVLLTTSQFFVTFLDFLAIAVIFGHVTLLDGWSASEVAFLYGTTGVAFQVGEVFISHVEHASEHIKRGTFDQFLIRPMGPMVQLCAHEFALRRVGKVVQALTVLVVAIATVPITWTVGSAVMLLVALVAGTVIFAAIWVVTASLSFWTVETQEVASSFTFGGNYITEYPLDVLTTWLRRLLVVVPLAFVNYVPACWILGKPDATGLPSWAAFASPVVAVLSALVARSVWATAIRHYRSTGS